LKQDGAKIIFSPTDLSTFFRSPYVSWLSHHNLVVSKNRKIEREENETQTLLGAKGDEFEKAEFKKLNSNKELSVVEIERENSFEVTVRKTIEAMQSGADIIYQAALEVDGFQGYADFLIKVPDRKSKLGNYSYEVADTKLSHSPKPEYALQVCCYSEMLFQILGHWPDKWHLYLGDGTTVSLPVSDYRFYYAHFKKVFLKFHEQFSLEKPLFPEPWENVTGYENHVDELFKRADHLCLVAGVGLGQIKRFKEMKIETRADLAKAKDQDRPRRMQPHVFERLREQAALQIQSDVDGRVAYRVLDPVTNELRGLARIPSPDSGDVIFDMEGYPFQEGGFEYLFGVLACENKKWNFMEWTAHDITQEKAVFEKFMVWLIERYRKHPELHIYHYAAYEPSALANLSNKYGTKVAEVDLLLANQVFVDLYQVVREGVRVGAPSYSIKKVEALYNFKRKSEVTTAGDSVVQFHNYLELKVVDPTAAQKILSCIVEYNKEDVESTLGLLAWLQEQKKLKKIPSMQRTPEVAEPKPTPDWEQIRGAISDHPPGWIKGDKDHLRVNELLANLAGYFHREERPVWWAFFNRQNSSPEDLMNDAECIAMAKVEGRETNGYRISFDRDQALKAKEGQGMNIQGQGSWDQVTLEKLDLNIGTAIISGQEFRKGELITLMPGGPLKTDSQKLVLIEMATRWAKQTSDKALSGAALDLMYRRPPRLRGVEPGSELYPESELPLEAALRLVRLLDNSCLTIQGPPGTGKTYTGGYIIANLLKEGKRVAVVAQGKKTIENLLQQTVDWWRQLFPKQALPKILMADNDRGGENPSRDYKYGSNSDARKRHDSFQLLGATHFVFSKAEFQTGSFDYLFIDEAGQFSLAASIVCSFVAQNIILLGDQMQLEQVNVGQHPGDSGLSVLNYYMNGQNTIPRTHGVFLNETWRMNPAISELISHLVYDDRLSSNARTHDHVLKIGDDAAKLLPCGILFYPVDHSHNSMRSEEEVDAIERLIADLKGTQVPSEDGKHRKFDGTEKDLIIITPYNAQVELIRSRIKGVRVGSVDLFQGQEAWVSVLSMCASGEEGLHRGLDFLLSKNRMNVGLSRAKALSIVVGSPRLLEIRPRNIKTIPLLNFYAALTMEESQ